MATSDELRQAYRQRRAALDEADLARAAGALCERIVALDEYREAQRIAAYFAVNGEIGLGPLIDAALEQGKAIYLPVIDRQTLRFAPYYHGQQMRSNRFRLPEPDVDDEAMLAPRQLDLVLAPLVVFDAERNRIGMGGGFYDRSFAFRREPGIARPRLIGVAHEMQRAAQLTPAAWDVRLDLVVTDRAVYR